MTTNNDAKAPKTKEPTVVKKTNYARQTALTLLTLVIIAGLGDALYNNKKLDDKLETLSAEALTLKQQQASTKTQFNSTLNTLYSTQKNLNEQLDDLKKNLSSAMQEHLYQNNDWLLLKARYYLGLAEINAHWSDNTPTTIALFQQADDLLVNLHEPQLLSVRQAIATDITQLQAIPTLDIAGLLAKLDATQHLIKTLPSKNPIALSKATTSIETSIKVPSTWREHLQSSIDLLRKLVIIRHHNAPIQPMLSAEDETLLRENIRLNLQEAQWAVLQKNQSVYDLALKHAVENINRAFDQKDERTQALIQQLQTLQSTQLKSETPAPGQSLLLLNQFIESKKTAPSGDLSSSSEGEDK